MRGLYYDDFAVGFTFEGTEITVTDTHVTLFAGLTGDFNPLHVNNEFCANTRFGERIAHGLLTLSLVVGQIFHPLVEGTVVANLGCSAKFTAPVKINDTLKPLIEVIHKEPKKNNGIVTFQMSCKNQRDETVLKGEISFIFLYRIS